MSAPQLSLTLCPSPRAVPEQLPETQPRRPKWHRSLTHYPNPILPTAIQPPPSISQLALTLAHRSKRLALKAIPVTLKARYSALARETSTQSK